MTEETTIAAENYYWRRANGEITLVVSKIGRPYEVESGYWRFDIELSGLRQPTFVSGASSMQVLSFAVVFAHLELASAVQAGGGALFNCPNAAEQLSALDILDSFDLIAEYFMDPHEREVWEHKRSKKRAHLEKTLASCVAVTEPDDS